MRRKLFVTALGAVAALVCVAALIPAYRWFDYYYLDRSNYIPPGFPPKPGHAFSCRNHITFVGIALGQYVQKNRWLPHDSKLPAEDLVRVLDPYQEGANLNCHHGAPNRRTGEWQMLNASPEAWEEILEKCCGDEIPILWCGRAHPRSSDSERVALLLGGRRPPHTLKEILAGVRKSGFMDSVLQGGITEANLQAALDQINPILVRHGERPIPRDVTELK